MTNNLEKFWAKVDKTGDCWLWTGAPEFQGYGRMLIQGTLWKAHRLSYVLANGPIPEGLVLDHLCHSRDPSCQAGNKCLHRRCVNPDHLEAVTPRENALRGNGVGALHRLKTHCPRGHPYSEENTRLYKGGRYCRICRRRVQNEYKKQHPEAVREQARRRRERRRNEVPD